MGKEAKPHVVVARVSARNITVHREHELIASASPTPMVNGNVRGGADSLDPARRVTSTGQPPPGAQKSPELPKSNPVTVMG